MSTFQGRRVASPKTGQVWQDLYGVKVTIDSRPYDRVNQIILVVYSDTFGTPRIKDASPTYHFMSTHSFYAHNKYHAMWKRFMGVIGL